MGRKPNPLILQHFERGAKLNDSSNRYEHTCKACGEKFPKGRIDSLTTHIVKKCPAISLRDRQKALLELHNLPDLHDPAQARNGEVQMNGPTVELPIGTNNWSALETLAEVSRQMDMNEKHDDRSVNNKSVGHGSRASEPPRVDRLELQEQYTLDNPPVSYEQRVQRDKKVLHHKITRRESEASLQAAALAYHIGSREPSPSLATTATRAMAATDMAAAAAAAFVPSMVDPQLLGDDVNGNHQDSMTAKAIAQELQEAANLNENYFQTPADQQSAWSMLDSSGAHLYSTEPDHSEHGFESHSPETSTPTNFARPLVALNHPMTTEFSAEYGNGQKANKPKVRGRFAAGRRKEVQEVRKKGACLRCRMLKKPCSGETPCATCKSVDSARLWRGSCVRTKFGEAIEMYSAGLHSVLAYHDVNLAKRQTPFVSSPNLIDACHFPDTAVFATFRALAGQEIPVMGNIDPGLSGDFTTNSRRLLDDSDDIPKKLEEYTKRVLPVFIQREPSHFMKVTLNTARQSSSEFLNRAMELWVIVHILVDDKNPWIISERIDDQAPAGTGPIIDKSAGDNTYDDLCGQLNAAAEKKAAQICKDVLNDFEKRLLQRSSTSAFDFFLVAIIILNCIEKSMWLFNYWDQDKFKTRWPLDKKPGYFVAQGDQLTNTIKMLLNVRSSPPKTFMRPDGILAADGDQAVVQYFDDVKLSYERVLSQSVNDTFDPGNSRCYELTLCSRLMLPSQA